jgi:hypothetical protein
MSAKMWENGYQTTMICIDSYDERVPVGRFYNQYCPDGISFHGAIDLLKKIETILNENKAVQSFSAVRSFAEKPAASVLTASGEVNCQGKVATFATKVLFRQNASWQGSVSWLEGQREEAFRSVLELLLLMDSAMGTEAGE